MIRVILPTHLWRLANTNREIEIQVEAPATMNKILTAIEDSYPMLRGTIREQSTNERRAFIRFFACGEDLSHNSPDAPLPEEVAKGIEPLRIVGALAGG
jgi:hypothetical protein